MDAEFPEELVARPLKQQILVIKERFLLDGTSFEDHKYSKTLQLGLSKKKNRITQLITTIYVLESK